jgi:chaperonin cofactor prefoldin
MEEKYKLLKEKERFDDTLAGRDTEAVAEYDKKVEALNRKIADYQKRRDAFQEEAEAVKKAVENPGS